MLTTAKSSVSVRGIHPTLALALQNQRNIQERRTAVLCALKTQIETKITAVATRITTSILVRTKTEFA